MQYIGFTQKYYTLWEVTEDATYTYYKYVQNASMDYNKAIAKYPNAIIDLSLRGHSSFKKLREHMPMCQFQFGKYKGQNYADCTDFDYMKWYYNVTDRDEIKKYVASFLTSNGYFVEDGKAMTKAEYDEYIRIKPFFPKFQTKVENGESFQFKVTKYPQKKYDGICDEERAIVKIPFCKISFKNFEEKEYNGYKYYQPTKMNGLFGGYFKNNVVVIDRYEATKVDNMEYHINVIEWH